MAAPANQYQFVNFNYDLDIPKQSHQYVFRDTATDKNYLLPTKPQGCATDALSLSYGKLHARKYFLIHATLGLPISIVVTAYKIAARVVKIISCLLPIPLGLSLKERAKTIKDGFKFIALQPFVTIAREAMNVYGIFKPFEATVWFANHQLSGIDGGSIYQAFDNRGFPLQSVEVMTDQEIQLRLRNLFEWSTARIDNSENDEGAQRKDLTLEVDTRDDTNILDGRLIELGQILRNMPNLRSLSLKNFGFINSWGRTAACLFRFAGMHRQPYLEEIILKEPRDTFFALPGQESVQALFDSNPQFKRLQITISQASIDANSRLYVRDADLLAPPSSDFSSQARKKNIEEASKMRDEAFSKVRQMHLNGINVTIGSYIVPLGHQPDSPETTIFEVAFQRKEV